MPPQHQIKRYENITLNHNATGAFGDEYRYGDTIDIQEAVFVCVNDDRLVQLIQSINTPTRPQRSILSSGKQPDETAKVQKLRDGLFHRDRDKSRSSQSSPSSSRFDVKTLSRHESVRRRMFEVVPPSPLHIQGPGRRLAWNITDFRPLKEALLITADCLTSENNIRVILRALPPALIALLVGRATSCEALLQILISVRNDPLLPLVTFIIGCCVAQYLSQTATRIPTVPSIGDFFILDDPYGNHVKVPTMVLGDIGIFEACLRAEYKQTSIEYYIKNGLYLLRSEYVVPRRPFTARTFFSFKFKCINNDIITLSILHRASSTTCLNCRTNLDVTDLQDNFHCRSCSLSIGLILGREVKGLNTAAFLIPPWQDLPQLYGPILHNVDYDLRWRLHLSKRKEVRAKSRRERQRHIESFEGILMQTTASGGVGLDTINRKTSDLTSYVPNANLRSSRVVEPERSTVGTYDHTRKIWSEFKPRKVYSEHDQRQWARRLARTRYESIRTCMTDAHSRVGIISEEVRMITNLAPTVGIEEQPFHDEDTIRRMRDQPFDYLS